MQQKIFLLYGIISLFLVTTTTYAQTVDSVTSVEIYSFLLENSTEHIPIIDGRDSAMFFSGHISHAIYIDAYSDEAYDFMKSFLAHKTLIIYCTTKNRSLQLIDILKSLKYTGNILFMTDGIRGWKEQRLPLELFEYTINTE